MRGITDEEWLGLSECGAVHDREVNAAKNIKARGLEQFLIYRAEQGAQPFQASCAPPSQYAGQGHR